MKAADRQQYLHCMSSHPHHTKRSIVYSKLWELVKYVHLKKTLKDIETK